MQPLVFEPFFRPQIWGHRRLAQQLGKPLPPEGLFGESWEISAHPLHVSCVAEGPLAGTRLTDLWQQHADQLAGTEGSTSAQFPLLIKYLDCHQQLSVQVHPDDVTARRLLKNESGKTEAWVVLYADSEARVYAGFKPGTTREDLERHLERGTVAECLHSFEPRPGDCVFLPPGTVHAAGGGVLMAEVQQSSDATFRLFDWNRTGPDGNPRTLHREEALQSIDWTVDPDHVLRAPKKFYGTISGNRAECLVRCSRFSMDRHLVADLLPSPSVGQMSIWMVLDGTAHLATADGYQRRFNRGETVLIPAASGMAFWRTETAKPAVLLAVTLPSGATSAR